MATAARRRPLAGHAGNRVPAARLRTSDRHGWRKCRDCRMQIAALCADGPARGPHACSSRHPIKRGADAVGRARCERAARASACRCGDGGWGRWCGGHGSGGRLRRPARGAATARCVQHDDVPQRERALPYFAGTRRPHIVSHERRGNLGADRRPHGIMTRVPPAPATQRIEATLTAVTRLKRL